ncbi:hypothetical protein [Hymenobacter tenuis]
MMITANLQFLHAPAPLWVSALFVVCTFLAAWLLGLTIQRTGSSPRTYWLLTSGWLAVQAGLALTGFYQTNLDVPPRLVLGAILPTLVLLVGLLVSGPGRRWMARLGLPELVRLSVVRVGVEIGLYGLVAPHLVPELMTFAGRNFDIVAGLTAPVVALLIQKQKLSRGWLVAWHVGALVLLLNIILLALLSAPTPAQKLAFEQPNVAVMRFPFVWLPAFIVPAVLFSHVASLYQLLRRPAAVPAASNATLANWHP